MIGRMEKSFRVVFYSLVLICAILTPYNDHWFGTWRLVLTAFALGLAVFATIRVDLSVGAMLFWALFSGISVFASKARYADLQPSSAMGMDNVALQAYAALVTLSAVFLMLPKRMLSLIEDTFRMLCLFNSWVTLISIWLGWRSTGLFGNDSMNGLFIAFTYPLIAMRPELTVPYSKLSIGEVTKNKAALFCLVRDYVWTLVPLAAVLIGQSDLPKLCIGFLFIAMFVFSKDEIKKGTNSRFAFYFVGLLFCLPLIYAVAFMDHDSGRFAIWKMAMSWWFEEKVLWEGTGLGTTFMWVPALQDIYQVNPGNYFIWMHNDILQILFETGMIGLILFLNMSYWLYQKAFKGDSYVLFCLLGYTFACIFNFPMHLAFHACFGLFLIRRIYDGLSEKNLT